MYPPFHQKESTSQVRWVLRSRMMTPPDAYVIAAEFRRIARDVYGYQQTFRDLIMAGIAESWTGLASEKYLDLYAPIAAELRALCEDLHRRAVEIENIQIREEWWEAVPDPYWSGDE